jgi:hypothetical protein
MSQTFYFSVLRYMNDPVTQEFINLGVVLYSPENSYLKSRISPNYGRATKTFGKVEGVRFRQVVRYVQAQIDSVGANLRDGSLFDNSIALEVVLSRILPVDDSSLVFAKGGGGISENLDGMLEQLFERYVNASTMAASGERRNRDEVWRSFRTPLEKRSIAGRLQPKRIVAVDYEYDFEHAWKNGVWNLYEPISFDLLESSAMYEKANKWVGRAFSLKESAEPFSLNLLLGSPQDPSLMDAYRRAENILNKMPVKHTFVREHEAEAFAKNLELELKHSA